MTFKSSEDVKKKNLLLPEGHPTQCCSADGRLITDLLSSPLCFPIIIPPNDPVYANGYTRQQCRNFVRSTTDLDRGCSSPRQPAEQLTVVTNFLDLSLVYGSSDDVAAGLRAGVGGRLVTDVRGNREWLPQATNKTDDCELENDNEICYASGEFLSNLPYILQHLDLRGYKSDLTTQTELINLFAIN